jgi:hypothetical protein
MDKEALAPPEIAERRELIRSRPRDVPIITEVRETPRAREI